MNPNTNYAALIQGIIGQGQNQADARDRKELSENQLIEQARQFQIADASANTRAANTLAETAKVNAADIEQTKANTEGQLTANRLSNAGANDVLSENYLSNYADNWQQNKFGKFSFNEINWMLDNDQSAVVGSLEAVQKSDPKFQTMMQNAGVEGKVVGAGRDENGGYYVSAVSPNGKTERVPIESGTMQYMTTYVQETLERTGRGASASNTMLAGAKYNDNLAHQITGGQDKLVESAEQYEPPAREKFNNRSKEGGEYTPTKSTVPNEEIKPPSNYNTRGNAEARAEAKALEPESDTPNRAYPGRGGAAKREEDRAKRQKTKEVFTSKTSTAGDKMKALKEDPSEAIKTFSQDPDSRVPGKRTAPPGRKFSSEAQAEADREFSAEMDNSAKQVVRSSGLQDRVWLAINQMANNGLSIKEANNFAMYGSTDIASTKTFIESVTAGASATAKVKLMQDIADLNKTRTDTAKTAEETADLSFGRAGKIADVVAAFAFPGRGGEFNEGYDKVQSQKVHASLSGSKYTMQNMGISEAFVSKLYDNVGELAESYKMGNMIHEQLNDGTNMFQTHNGDRVLIGAVAREAGIMGAYDKWYTDSRAADEIQKFYDLGKASGKEPGFLMAAFLDNKDKGLLGPSATIDDFIDAATARYVK
jgi:hypothetical protein